MDDDFGTRVVGGSGGSGSTVDIVLHSPSTRLQARLPTMWSMHREALHACPPLSAEAPIAASLQQQQQHCLDAASLLLPASSSSATSTTMTTMPTNCDRTAATTATITVFPSSATTVQSLAPLSAARWTASCGNRTTFSARTGALSNDSLVNSDISANTVSLPTTTTTPTTTTPTTTTTTTTNKKDSNTTSAISTTTSITTTESPSAENHSTSTEPTRNTTCSDRRLQSNSADRRTTDWTADITPSNATTGQSPAVILPTSVQHAYSCTPGSRVDCHPPATAFFVDDKQLLGLLLCTPPIVLPPLALPSSSGLPPLASIANNGDQVMATGQILSSAGQSSPSYRSGEVLMAPWLLCDTSGHELSRSFRKVNSGVDRLHSEILQFYEYMLPTEAEMSVRTCVINRISDVIERRLHGVDKVEVFGSFRTGLFLPTSDIDVVVFGHWDHDIPPLSQLKNILVQENISDESYMKVLDRASVPIIKLSHPGTGLRFDISFNKTNGRRSVELIREFLVEFPALRYLVIILKYFLLQRDLNEVFTGGIGSYSLTMMTVSFLQLHPVLDCRLRKNCNLGELMLGFFELYGRRFSYGRVGLRIRDGGAYVPREELAKDFKSSYRSSILCIEDPLDSANDIGKGSYSAVLVRWYFDHVNTVLLRTISSLNAYFATTEAENNNNNNNNNASSNKNGNVDESQLRLISIIGKIMGITTGMMRYRQFLQSHYDMYVSAGVISAQMPSRHDNNGCYNLGSDRECLVATGSDQENYSPSCSKTGPMSSKRKATTRYVNRNVQRRGKDAERQRPGVVNGDNLTTTTTKSSTGNESQAEDQWLGNVVNVDCGQRGKASGVGKERNESIDAKLTDDCSKSDTASQDSTNAQSSTQAENGPRSSSVGNISGRVYRRNCLKSAQVSTSSVAVQTASLDMVKPPLLAPTVLPSRQVNGDGRRPGINHRDHPRPYYQHHNQTPRREPMHNQHYYYPKPHHQQQQQQQQQHQQQHYPQQQARCFYPPYSAPSPTTASHCDIPSVAVTAAMLSNINNNNNLRVSLLPTSVPSDPTNGSAFATRPQYHHYPDNGGHPQSHQYYQHPHRQWKNSNRSSFDPHQYHQQQQHQFRTGPGGDRPGSVLHN